MCTATWWRGPNSFELFFNRDELKTRPPGLPPVEASLKGTRYLAPTDSLAGGTWVFVNEHGLAGALINQYPDKARSPGQQRVSRGTLTRSLAACDQIEALDRHLRTTDLARYEGFLFIALTPGQPARIFRWNTHVLHVENETPGAQPLTSSRHLSDEVVRERRHRFTELVQAHGGDPSPGDLRTFHERHCPDSAAHSVFMQRDDAETVSLTHIVVDAATVRLAYSPKLPGQFRFAPAHRLALPRHAPAATA